MEPLYLKKNTQLPYSSFLSLKTDVPHLYDKWHYHRELELLYVINGKGTRFIGDSVQDFSHGDIVLVGANLPHVWINEREYYSKKDVNASAILIQFLEEVIGDKLLMLPEMQSVRTLLLNSSRGIKVSEDAKIRIAPILEELVHAEGAKRIILLLSVLEEIACSDYEMLSSHWFSKSYTDSKNDRVNKVCDYIIANFKEKIVLENLAALVSMNKAALCRYFKDRTKKTITEFINEIRIGYAFNLINTQKYSVTRACFESGFNSLSYFNRQFQKVTGHSPSAVKKKIR